MCVCGIDRSIDELILFQVLPLDSDGRVCGVRPRTERSSVRPSQTRLIALPVPVLSRLSRLSSPLLPWLFLQRGRGCGGRYRPPPPHQRSFRQAH